MSYSHIDYNWQATIGGANVLSKASADYLDLLQSLCQDDGYYPVRTANLHTCAIDDPMVMLHHAYRTGLCVTLEDHVTFDRTCTEVMRNRPRFYCEAEIERRMQAADGDCPMCGFAISWNGADSQGMRSQITHCQHNLGHRVPEDQVDAYLRRPNSWMGSHWPYAYMEGHKLRDLSRVADHQVAPCQGCLEMEAMLRMEYALLDLVGLPKLERFSKDGSSPVSEYASLKDGKPDNARMYMRVKQTMRRAQEGFGSHETRLNGAGLKLYIKVARGGYGCSHREVVCGMRVGGDQVDLYPGFADFAHQLFAELSVPVGEGKYKTLPVRYDD